MLTSTDCLLFNVAVFLKPRFGGPPERLLRRLRTSRSGTPAFSMSNCTQGFQQKGSVIHIADQHVHFMAGWSCAWGRPIGSRPCDVGLGCACRSLRTCLRRRAPRGGASMQGMPARAGEAGGGPAQQPEGMDREARLLTSFAEVALHSKAWVRQAPGVGACINVRRAAARAVPIYTPTAHHSWQAVSSTDRSWSLCYFYRCNTRSAIWRRTACASLWCPTTSTRLGRPSPMARQWSSKTSSCTARRPQVQQPVPLPICCFAIQLSGGLVELRLWKHC